MLMITEKDLKTALNNIYKLGKSGKLIDIKIKLKEQSGIQETNFSLDVIIED